MKKKRKRILIATNHLADVGGSELYTYDLIKALTTASTDYHVEFFSLDKGLISEKIERELHVPFMSQKRYDLIFASHNTTVKELFNRGPIIQICHGTVPELEQPSPLADYHVAVSEEVANHLMKLGYPSDVVLNGVDVCVKKPLTPVNGTLTSVLSLCQSDIANATLRSVCEMKGLHFQAHNKHKNPTYSVEHEINNFDLVVGIGRSIYDAMACGRPCIIYDHRGYNGNRADGYLHPDNFPQYVKMNCSGRYLNRQYQEKDLLRELEKYNPENGQKLRSIAADQLNVYKMADQLLQTTKRLTWSNRLRKWKRFAKNTKLLKRAFLYKKLYGLTKSERFSK